MTTTSASGRCGLLVLAGLLALTVVPVLAGTARLVQLATGAPVTPENARFFDSPLPVVVHVVGATLFVVGGAFQLVPAMRRRRLRLHRTIGRVVVPAGLAAAVSGLWMAVRYDLPASDDALLMVFRLVFGTGMVVALVLGAGALRRSDIRAHGRWMARGYAIGMGAGTQVLTNVPWVVVAGPPGHAVRAWLMFAGWAINLVVVELVLRRARRPRTRGGAVGAVLTSAHGS